MFDVNDYFRYSDEEDEYYNAQYNKYHSDDEDAEKFIELGAERLGTSRIVAIVKNIE